MPVVFVRLGNPSSGCSQWKFLESIPGIDYHRILKILQFFVSQPDSSTPKMTKEAFQQLLSFTQSRRERETLSYAIIKSSGLSLTAARNHFGVENIVDRCQSVEKAMEESRLICEGIASLASIQEKSALVALGFSTAESSSSEESNTSDDSSSSSTIPSRDFIMRTLRESDWNWFEFVSVLCEEESFDDDTEQWLESIYLSVPLDNLSSESRQLLQQSHNAYTHNRHVELAEDVIACDAANGIIVPDLASPMESKSLDEMRDTLFRRIRSIRRHCRYLRAKAISNRNFLKRKSSKRLHCILQDYPDIGETIEKFVTDSNVGADSWRRTGILTFDGNLHVGKKVTFSRIKAYLEDRYHRKFSYGTVVELCPCLKYAHCML